MNLLWNVAIIDQVFQGVVELSADDGGLVLSGQSEGRFGLLGDRLDDDSLWRVLNLVTCCTLECLARQDIQISKGLRWSLCAKLGV